MIDFGGWVEMAVSSKVVAGIRGWSESLSSYIHVPKLTLDNMAAHHIAYRSYQTLPKPYS